MKKSYFKVWFYILFSLCVLAGGIWLVFLPLSHQVQEPQVRVKVETAKVEPEILAPTSAVGDEQVQSKARATVEEVKPEPQAPSGHNKPQISIIIDDVGVDIQGSKRAMQLPAYVTLSFIPYSTRLREQTKDARDLGHELMLHMPMEPLGHADPGPDALLVNLPMDELRQRFESALASFVGFDGVNNHMGSKFTSFQPGMDMVMDELKPRHLFFLDSRTSGQSIGEKVAREKGVPTISRDVFLDDDQTLSLINNQLEETERIARRKGYAIAIGHPHTTTLEALEKWLPEAEARGIVFVPVRQLIKESPDQSLL